MHAADRAAVDGILTFWFGTADAAAPCTASPEVWFRKSEETDARIRADFGAFLEEGATGALTRWETDAAGHLAHVVLLDQFSRNAFRDTPRAFAQDGLALASALRALDGGVAAQVATAQRTFFFLPLMHAEDRALQHRQVALYEELATTAEPAWAGMVTSNVDYAKRHCEIVERFGRFPHRNALLGRPSTEAEIAFLKEPGSSF